MPLKRQEAAFGQCQATNKAGAPCQAPAIRAGTFCALHQEPSRASQLGRLGGEARRPVSISEGPLLPAPETAQDVKKAMAQVFAELRGGKLDLRVAKVLAYVGTVLLKCVEVSELEPRVRGLEGVIKAIQKRGNNESR